MTADADCSQEIKRRLLLGRKALTNLDSTLKSKRHYFANKGPSYGFSSNHVWTWELDYKESWVLKNWCFWTVVLEKTLESPLEHKEIQSVNPKGNQSWIFIGRTDAEAETPILGHLMQRIDSLEKTLMLGNIEGGRRRGWQRMNGCMASPIQWTWVWASSMSWWWTAKPGMLQAMGLQRVRHDWVTELNWTEKVFSKLKNIKQEMHIKICIT